MNTKLFFEAINEVSDSYYEEAANYRCKRKKPYLLKWSTAAACTAIVCIAVFSVLFDFWERQKADISPNSDPLPPVSQPTDVMEHVFINEISGLADGQFKWAFPSSYDNVLWDEAAIFSYYGKDLTPPYIPNGLTPAPGNGIATVFADENGNIAWDTVTLNFYHAYYEDGSPKLTENVSAVKGFSVKASKLGLLNDCYYILPEDEVKSSDINGTAVTFGYRSISYGPYDPNTHAPAGYYDLYVAEFEQNGIKYQIIAEQMEIEEVVKVVSSMIAAS